MSIAPIRQIAARADLPEAVMAQALEWLVVVWSREATPEQLLALERWRGADPRHERAWCHVQQLDERLGALPDAVAADSLRAADRAVDRRKFLLTLGLVALGGGTGYALRNTALVQSHLADIRTTTGEIRELTLADGTRLTLNTASAVNVRYDDDMRRLLLIEGELLIATAADSRPLWVETAVGRVRPLGTRFTVRHADDRAEVAVLEGAVVIHPRLEPSRPARLEAGGRVRFSGETVQPLAATVAPAAWAEGLLVVEQMPLGEVLAELARYRRGIIRCHPDAAALRVSGTFPVGNTDRALAALARALPIRVSFLSRFWVSIEVR